MLNNVRTNAGSKSSVCVGGGGGGGGGSGLCPLNNSHIVPQATTVENQPKTMSIKT